MTEEARKNHWEHIYKTKALSEVSWYEPIPKTSLEIFKSFQIPKTAKIIDVGGGDSFLADSLLKQGYQNITVLDISQAAILRAQQRLGPLSQKINWIVSDITAFKPKETYDFWHDRAAFHFLNAKTDIEKYIKTAHHSLSEQGLLSIGTFSENGPKKCSGINITPYSEINLVEQFIPLFSKMSCSTHTHITPFNTKQEFTFCSFKKNK